MLTFGIVDALNSDGPTNIYCIAEGGITKLSECDIISLTEVRMTTDSHSVVGEKITLNYFGLVKKTTPGFDVPVSIPDFKMEIFYKGALFAGTNANFSMEMNSTMRTMPDTDITLDYYPRNEGVKAQYEFTFKLSANINKISSK